MKIREFLDILSDEGIEKDTSLEIWHKMPEQFWAGASEADIRFTSRRTLGKCPICNTGGLDLDDYKKITCSDTCQELLDLDRKLENKE